MPGLHFNGKAVFRTTGKALAAALFRRRRSGAAPFTSPAEGDRIQSKPKGFENPGEQEATMKGDPKLIKVLNSLLADELTAINQYMVHSEMCDNWGYEKLHKLIEKRAVTEMKHAEKLIGRILFLEGVPIVSELKAIHIGADVPKMFANDHEAEMGAVKSYNAAIILAGDLKDYATRDILQDILKDEDAHVDEIEAVQDQIGQMGLQVFLSAQV
jgi:bacterioferritin